MLGLLITLAEMIFFVVFSMAKKISIHRSYNGLVETAFAVTRFLVLGKIIPGFRIR